MLLMKILSLHMRKLTKNIPLAVIDKQPYLSDLDKMSDYSLMTF